MFQKQAQTRFGTTFVPKTKGTKFVPRLQFFLTLSYFFQNKLLEPRRLAVKNTESESFLSRGCLQITLYSKGGWVVDKI